jgi:predicted Zn-dependent protease
MYKTAYDPEAFVDFFEKIQALEKKKPGTVSKFFSTYPPTEDRIVVSQKNIQTYLKARDEYTVTTSPRRRTSQGYFPIGIRVFPIEPRRNHVWLRGGLRRS